MTDAISPDFPFDSNYVDVLGSRMHYVDDGEGDPVLFLHGNPTWSYLWRNIIPHVSPHARCVAPDLIGMGKSDKPDIAYRFEDHARYLDAFIEKLDLRDITLVIHDWGSGLGLHYARRHPENVRAIAFMEAILGPMKWEDFPPEFRLGFRLFRAPITDWLALQVLNLFINQVMRQSIVRKLSPEEWKQYKKPYPTIASRKPIRQWPGEIPIEGRPADLHEIATQYRAWLEETEFPKLFFYAHPGAIIPGERAPEIARSFKNIETVDVGEGFHFLQEDHPHLIGRSIADWLQAFS